MYLPFSYIDPICIVGRIYGTTSCGSHGFREDFFKFSIEAYDSMASIDTMRMDGRIYAGDHKVRKRAKIRNRYNQAPHLTQDTKGKVTTSQLDTTNESQEVSPFQAGDHKTSINIRARKHNKNKTEIT